MNPPLRTAEDREALRAGVADGTIDAIATDHAPHAVEEKEAEFDQSPPGTIGLETALAAVLTELVEPGILTLGRAIEALSTAPARILGAADHGGPIEPGRPANLVVFDPRTEWVVEPPFASKSRNSAFLGSRAARPGRPHGAAWRVHRRRGEGRRGERSSPPRSWLSRTAPCSAGPAFGAEGEAFGEAVFNTGMAGYQEVLTDPSYAGQIVAMTARSRATTG